MNPFKFLYCKFVRGFHIFRGYSSDRKSIYIRCIKCGVYEREVE